MEMAQAFRRLGSQVTIIGDAKPFIHDDPDAAAIVIERIASEGVRIVTDSLVTAVAAEGEAIIVHFGEERVSASHLLIAAGRTTDFSGLGLEAAGVAYDRAGIIVDARRRTSAKHIYAIGDCRPGPHFTHASGYEGSNIALEVGLGLPTKADYRALPWVTYTDPELAQVGMTEAAARAKYGDKVRVFREDFDHNDRAIAEGDTAGFVKIVKAGGKLVGATIVGAHAGDHVLPWAMAITGKASLFGMASLIVPYPNRTEHDKAAAFATQNDLVFNRWSRGWAGFVAGLRRALG
jgi:pyruvate/2-oxoglutarate dehydrogenase complex dihydrolipoamide dehydrogenase (E3) component